MTDSSATLTWHAPGDDGMTGQASSYDLRYSLEALTAETWEGATATSPPTPGEGGSAEVFTITGLSPNTTYSFGIKTADEVPNWSAISNVTDSATPDRLCSPTAPESLLCRMEVLYNDPRRTVADRIALYGDLFSKDFIFHLQPADILNGLPPSWGTDVEVEALRAIFTAQENGAISSLMLSMVHDAAQNVDPPQPGREGWKEIFVTNLYLRLMFNPYEGMEVNAHQAEVHFQPTGDRWTIGEWWDLPRPEPRLAVETTSFGSIKAHYLP